MIYNCPCGATTEYAVIGGHEAAEMMRETSWERVYCGVQGFIWICPDCHKKVKSASEQIFSVLKTPHLSSIPFLDRKTVEDWNESYHRQKSNKDTVLYSAPVA